MGAGTDIFSGLRWPDLDQLQDPDSTRTWIACHEAGHALVAGRLGHDWTARLEMDHPRTCGSVVPGNGSVPPLVRMAPIAWGGPVAQHMAFFRVEAAKAFELAWKLFVSFPADYFSGPDLTWIRRHPHPREAGKLAATILRGRHHAIERLAQMLVERGSVTRDEFHRADSGLTLAPRINNKQPEQTT